MPQNYSRRCMIWKKLIQCKDNIVALLDQHCAEYQEDGMHKFNNTGWINRTWRNDNVRRAHIDVVDARDTKGLWMMHVCLFPELTNGGPIYGFDVIAGKNKVTGAFHDFSPLLKKDHALTQWFVDSAKSYQPSKARELPDWAKAIFSGGMIAAGNIQDEQELTQVCSMAENNLNHYLQNIGDYKNDSQRDDVIAAQNYYCEHQMKNPHTPRVMLSLGLPEDLVNIFVAENLFPKV
jgi:phycocyanobilin:ferredoxin oxidoreductase